MTLDITDDLQVNILQFYFVHKVFILHLEDER